MSAPQPLTPEQRQTLEQAGERAKAFTGAAKVAAFNGWSIGFFAAVTVLFGIFSLTALVLGVGMGVVARNEFKGRARTLAPDPAGPDLLWRNQVGFMALIIVYCLWSLYLTTARPDPQMAELTELLGGDLDEVVRSLTITVYVAVIALTALFQGLNARYYFRRIAMIEEYLSETPGSGPLEPVWYKCLLPAKASDWTTSYILEAPLWGFDRTSFVRFGFQVRGNESGTVDWVLDANGVEVLGSRVIPDVFKINPEQYPDPEKFRLGPLPPVVDRPEGGGSSERPSDGEQ